MTKSAKGSCFERNICKKLSLWWSEGKDDSIFWRTSGSGARAKTRSKQGKSTFGQYGDIQAVNPVGQILIDNITFELKRGYGNKSIFDLVDSYNTTGFPEWYEQVTEDQGNADSKYFALITRRDRRKALIIIPANLRLDMVKWFGNNVTLNVFIASVEWDKKRFLIGRFDDFVEKIDPVIFKEMLNDKDNNT